MSDTPKRRPFSLTLSSTQRYDFIRFLLRKGENPPRLNLPPKGMNAAKVPETPARFKIRWKGARKAKERQEKRTQGFWKCDPFGLSYGEERRRKEWILERDGVREQHLSVKRQARINPLHRISEQLLVKPKRVVR
jgi:hypothetical protein